MFDSLDALAEQLLATTPTQDNPCEPTLDPDGSLLDRALYLERVKGAADAEQMLIYTAMTARAQSWQQIHDSRCETQLGPGDLVAAEIAAALHLAPVTAAIRVDRAERIVTRLPGTHAAYRNGELDLGRVLAIDEATRCLSDADTAKVEELILPGAVDQTAGELRAALGKAVIRVDPRAAEKRRKQSIKDRSVTRYQDKDGTSVLKAVLSAVDTGEIYDLIDQIARQTKTTGDTRSMDARRADALVLALLGRDPHLGPEDDDDPPPASTEPSPDDQPSGPNEDGPEPDPEEPGHDLDHEVAAPCDHLRDLEDPGPDESPDPEEVLPDLERGLVNHRWRDAELTRFQKISELALLALSAMTSRRPPKLPWVAINPTTGPDGEPIQVGELPSYGPITADYARHLLATGAATAPPEPSGRSPTPAQARTHDPPDWLAKEIKARDGTCRFPGCRQPAHRVDLDHVIPFPSGLTVRTNLGGLCRRHHRVKGSGCWRVIQHDDGIYQWTSNITGGGYTTYPRGSTGDWRGTTNHRENGWLSPIRADPGPPRRAGPAARHA